MKVNILVNIAHGLCEHSNSFQYTPIMLIAKMAIKTVKKYVTANWTHSMLVIDAHLTHRYSESTLGSLLLLSCDKLISFALFDP